jgi:hypothetical protein
MTTQPRSLVVIVLAVVVSATGLAAYAITGPSSSSSPYVIRNHPGVVTAAILSVGDAVGRYRLVGIPDGLGAFDNSDGTFTLLVNHEIPDTRGTTRAHGARGAFVSKWLVRKKDLAVIHGADLIQEVVTWNPVTGTWNAPAKGVAMSRFCSADLPPISSLYDAQTGVPTINVVLVGTIVVAAQPWVAF